MGKRIYFTQKHQETSQHQLKINHGAVREVKTFSRIMFHHTQIALTYAVCVQLFVK